MCLVPFVIYRFGGVDWRSGRKDFGKLFSAANTSLLQVYGKHKSEWNDVIRSQ